MKVRGRPRKAGASLPPGVHCVRAGSKRYYYWQPGRSGKNAGKRVALGQNSTSPEFWAKLARLMGQSEREERTDTFDALINAYCQSPEWTKNIRPDTRKNYNTYLTIFRRVFGNQIVGNMMRRDILKLRDEMQDTPSAANAMLKVLRTLLQWAVDHEYCEHNPATLVKFLKISQDAGHRPWPDEVYAYVMANAPEVIKRMAYLGRATGQREADLIRMCPGQFSAKKIAADDGTVSIVDGLHIKISKLRDKAHFVALMAHQVDEIRSWIEAGQPPERPFLLNSLGKKLTTRCLRRIWAKWRDSTWLKDTGVTIHGLKVTAVCDWRGKVTDGSIAKAIDMSPEMIKHYSRFMDAEQASRECRDEREKIYNTNVVKFAKSR